MSAGRKRGWVLIAGLVVVLALVGYFALRPAPTMTVRGSISVFDLDGGGWAGSSGACTLSGGYGDIQPGAQVTVTGEDGKTLAIGSLGQGKLGAPFTCVLPFTVRQIPVGEKFYRVEVTHRGAVVETERQMRAGPDLSLGGP